MFLRIEEIKSTALSETVRFNLFIINFGDIEINALARSIKTAIEISKLSYFPFDLSINCKTASAEDLCF